MKNKIIVILLLIFLSQCKEKEETLFAGGFIGGTYDTMAKSLQDIPALKVKVVNSNGSLDNINLLLDQKADFALTQVDMYYSAKLGNAAIHQKTAILLPVLQDEIHLLVNPSIKKVSDLKGKKIAIGHSVSGIKATSISVLRLCGIDFDQIIAMELGPEEALPKLLNQEIDALFIVSGLPVKILSALPESSSEKIQLLSLDNSVLDKIKADNKVYQRSIIPEKTYVWQKESVNTLQVQTVLLARKDLSAKHVSTFVNGLFSNLETLISAHPEWRGINQTSLKEKLTVMPEFFHPLVKAKVK